jgi:hypothetical protein
LFTCFHAEASSGGEVTALHDAGGDEDFRIGIVNLFQTAGAFEVANLVQWLSVMRVISSLNSNNGTTYSDRT